MNLGFWYEIHVWNTTQLRLVQAWIELHRDELKANWEIAISGEKPYKINPL
jgi:hypothetical protein